MINVTYVHTALFKRVGWRQPTQTEYAILTTDNLASSSGLYFDDFSGFSTIEMIKNHIVDKDISSTNFNTWLTNFQKAAINKVVNAVCNRDDLKENQLLYPYENVKSYTLDNNGDFVGFEIDVAKRKDIAVVINQIICEFDASEAITLYLFHSSQQTAIATYSITTTANSAKYTTAGTVLYFQDISKSYSGGKFYLGYLTSGMTAKALNREWNSANVRNSFSYVGIKPIKVSGWTSTSLFAIDDIEYEGDTYGLNFDISVYEEYSDIISMNKQRFDRAIGLQVACDVLNQIVSSVRANRVEKDAYEKAMIELNGAYTETGRAMSIGLIKRLDNEIENIQKILFPRKLIQTGTLS